MKNKVCSKCRTIKPVSEFFKNKNTKDGLQAWCGKCMNKYYKNYYQKNKERLRKYYKKYQRKYQKNNPIKVWCHRTITYHKQKGFALTFTNKELSPMAEKIKYCPICECKLDWKYGSKNKRPQIDSPTLDRINNKKTLTLNNIQILCHRCNSAKGQMNMKEFVEYCSMISNKFKKDVITK